jgi:hypothetical protein
VTVTVSATRRNNSSAAAFASRLGACTPAGSTYKPSATTEPLFPILSGDERTAEKALTSVSKYPPAKPGALECWPLKAAGQVADATPDYVATEVAGLSPEIHLFRPLLLLFLIADVVPDHLFIPANRRYKISARPKALANEIPPVLPTSPCEMNRASPFDDTNHL